MTPAPIAIWTDERVSCGALAWRFRGRAELTIVVKATFAIVPDEPATPAGPGEIVGHDRHPGNNPLRSAETPGDLAPYLARCDVLFSGHAHVYGSPANATTVRLGLAREGRPLLDKTLHVFGDRGPSGQPQPFSRMPLVYERAFGPEEANPVGSATPNVVDPKDARRPAGFGPIAREWGVRRKLLGAADAKALDAPIATVPDGISWDYFQAAPLDQQVAHLTGGEWLLLEGLHPARPRVQTRLPAAPPIARIVGLRHDRPPVDRPIALVCDTVLVDGDRQRVSLTWRARYPLAAGESALSTLRVVAQLAPDSKPVEKPRLAALANVPMVRGGAATMAITIPAGESPRPALPFAGSSAASTIGSTTMDARPASAAATPWDAAPIIPPPPAEEEMVTETLSMVAGGLVVAEPPPPATVEIATPPPPPAKAFPSSPPPREVWAPAPAPPPLPPTPAAAPRPFERPLAAGMKSALYAKFARDGNDRR